MTYNLEISLLTIASLLYIVSILVLIILYISNSSLFKTITKVFFILATIFTSASYITRAAISSALPVATHYESLLFLLTLSSLVISVSFFTRRGTFLYFSPLVSLLSLICLITYEKHAPLLPILRSHWLTIHVGISMLSYLAFLFSFASSIYSFFSSNNERITRAANFAYRMVKIGHPLLAAGIISGSVWANSAWGRYWGWDPKETWALITWLLYTLYLHLRLNTKISERKLSLINIIAFLAVIFTYFGVNFLLQSLHSYSSS